MQSIEKWRINDVNAINAANNTVNSEKRHIKIVQMAFKTILSLTLMLSQLYSSGYGLDNEPKFVTCEFDLVDDLIGLDPDILDILPIQCKNAYNDSTLRQSMKEESRKFQDFITELGNRENWNEQYETADREVLDLNFDLRANIYESTQTNCTAASENDRDFVDCKIKGRDAIIKAITEME